MVDHNFIPIYLTSIIIKKLTSFVLYLYLNNMRCFGMVCDESYERRLEDICNRWVSYEDNLALEKDIRKEATPLMNDINALRHDYISDYGNPTLIQRVFISLNVHMYKSYIFRPLRKVILEKDDKVFYLSSLKTFEDLVKSSLYNNKKNN